jgi:hypothetical protein
MYMTSVEALRRDTFGVHTRCSGDIEVQQSIAPAKGKPLVPVIHEHVCIVCL